MPSTKPVKKHALLVLINSLLLSTQVFASTVFEPTYFPPGFIGGEAHLTYDRQAWATLLPTRARTDIHGIPIEGSEGPTSDTKGNRFLYPQLFLDHNSPTAIKRSELASEARIANGTADPEAVAQWRIYNQDEWVPLDQPPGGFTMQVDDLRAGVWWPEKSGWVPSSYNPYPGEETPLTIGLGGSLRLHSDFIAPGASLWFASLDIRLQQDRMTQEYKWYIGSSGGVAPGSIFELINPVFGVDPTTGYTTLSADYKWGASQWSNFFHFNAYPGDITEKVLGHISMNVGAETAPVPVPAAVWLFGSALAGWLGFKRRTAVLA
ncbi:hypothetical protein PL263_10615 [Methylomonas sp. EFPC3]|uniref:hypothetical protein n=1 Tax=Methylomonas sp. EFPC3 TaxID=3021710 RepID=UPI002415F031|nr:hypothetical protein [Methylomonas sp. EFPC3]WFP48565.1 hypothetical protein PL263_10615 [Methylomonas sp. EFPC3]